MESRPLWTLPLPHNILSALSRAGYETFADIQSATATPQALADGLSDQPDLQLFSHQLCISEVSMPLSSAESVLSTLDTFGRDGDVKINSASTLLSQEIKPLPLPIALLGYESLAISCTVDVSGPPGSGRSIFALSLIREAVRHGQEVLIIGNPFRDLFFPDTNTKYPDNQGQLSRERIYREFYPQLRDKNMGK